MKNILILILTLLVSNVFAQNLPNTYVEHKGVYITGQSNAKRFHLSGGADSLGTLMSVLWSQDTTDVIIDNRGASFLHYEDLLTDWNPSSEGEHLDSFFIMFQGYVDPLIAIPTTRAEVGRSVVEVRDNRAVKLSVLVWIQGENDTTTPESADSYLQNLRELIPEFRKRFRRPNLRILVIKLGAPYTPPTGSPANGKVLVNAAFDTVATEDANVIAVSLDHLINSDYEEVDGRFVHYEVAGAKKVAVAIRDAIQTAGW